MLMPLTPAADWVATECVLCGPIEASVVLAIPAGDGAAATSVVRCARCGLRRLTPRPGPAALTAFYGTDYNAFVGRTRSGTKQRVWDRLRDASARPIGYDVAVPARWILGPFANWAFDINVPLGRRTGLRVIDIGCGFGDLLIYLRSRGCETLGVDLDPRSAAQAAHYGVDIRVGTVSDLALPAASFDVAVMCHSLEHVPDPSADLREVARILKPGGRLHIAVPNGASAGLQIEGRDWAHLSHPLHVWFFDRTTLGALLERHGFRLVSEPYSTSRWHHVTRWASRVRSAPLNATSRLGRLAGEAARRGDSGDVLRLVAERVAQS
jgi:2-polyprenyl-3-methyl-5-hydroxy-6-metoxy-1,4-benzoquinol methylase